MSAATTARATDTLGIDPIASYIAYGIKANTKLVQGAMAALDSTGHLIQAAATAGLIVVGVPDESNFGNNDLDNTGGADDAFLVNIRTGTFNFGNSAGGDAIANKDAGSLCYVVDNQTVALTSSSGTRPVAGKIISVESDGSVNVEIRPGIERQITDQPTPPAAGGTGTSTAPTDAQILIGQTSGKYAPKSVSGDVTIDDTGATTIGANKVTGPKMASSAFRGTTVAGHNGAGAVTFTGAKVGDKVLLLSNITDGTDGSGSFEATITVNDQIQQSSASDLSLKKFLILLLAQS